MQAFVRRMLAPLLTITALSFAATIASAMFFSKRGE